MTFNLVQVEPKVCRGSISSVCTVSTSPILTQSIGTTMLGNNDNHSLIRPELMQHRTPVCRNGSFSAYYSSTESLASCPINSGTEVPVLKTEQQQEEMFERIKAYCAKNPLLFKKMSD